MPSRVISQAEPVKQASSEEANAARQAARERQRLRDEAPSGPRPLPGIQNLPDPSEFDRTAQRVREELAAAMAAASGGPPPPLPDERGRSRSQRRGAEDRMEVRRDDRREDDRRGVEDGRRGDDRRGADDRRGGYDRRGDDGRGGDDRRGADRGDRRGYDDRRGRGGDGGDDRRAEDRRRSRTPAERVNLFGPDGAKARREILDRAFNYNDKKQKKKSKWDDDPVAPLPDSNNFANGGIQPRALKGEMCGNFINGHCTEGDTCMLAHSLRELAPGGIKPRFCPDFLAPGGCPRQQLCFYAHSKEELSPGFKTSVCQTFYTRGSCRSGKVCKFAHGNDELYWFTEYMKVPEQPGMATDANGAGPLAAGLLPTAEMGTSVMPASRVPQPKITYVDSNTGREARNKLNPSQVEGDSGQAGFLLSLRNSMPSKPAPPSRVPKLNLAKLPATMKAPGWQLPTAASPGILPRPAESQVFAKSVPKMSPPSMSPPGLSSPPAAMNASAPPSLASPPAQKASPPANPMAASMMERLGALREKASRGICLQFEMGGCTKDNCQLSHDIALG